MKIHQLLAATVLVGASFVSGAAGAVTLDFDGDVCSGSTCGDGSGIDQSYGDGVGVDVIYDADGDGPDTAGFSFWSAYGALAGVAYAFDGAMAEIFLKPVGGSTITLLGFDLASWGDEVASQYRILDGLGNLLEESGQILVGSSSPFNVTGSFSSSDGIRLQLGPDIYNVGIDNIVFEVEGGTLIETPLPAAGTGLPLALGLAAVWAYRRKRAAA